MGLVTTNLIGVVERLMAGRMRAATVDAGMVEAGEASRRAPAAVYLGLGFGVAQLHMSLMPRLSWCMLMRKKPPSPQYVPHELRPIQYLVEKLQNDVAGRAGASYSKPVESTPQPTMEIM